MSTIPFPLLRPPSDADAAGSLVASFPSGLPRSLRLELESQQTPPEAWAVNWVDATGDLVCHFNPRPAEGCVVLNTFRGGAWGEELLVRSYPFPTRPDASFRVAFEALDDEFAVDVDGRRFCTFPHRAPRSAVRELRSTIPVWRVDPARAPRILAFERDLSWLAGVRAYAGMDEATFADYLGCFFHERLAHARQWLPAWALELDAPAHAEKRRALTTSHGWQDGEPLQEVVHLELIAHEPRRRAVHEEWLAALDPFVSAGAACEMLDYGSGASSFAELALEHEGVRATLADVLPECVDYYRAKYARLGDRVSAVTLPVTRSGTGPRHRVAVDHRRVTGRFHAVVVTDVLEHTLDPLAVLLHLLGSLRPGGIVVVKFPLGIEGDWHTPEAYYLRRWCFALLEATCDRLSDAVWRKRSGRAQELARRTLQVAAPLLRSRARAFARRYFREHGDELVASLRARGRPVTTESLLASVRR
jgi:hypothetical protein